MTRSPQTRRTKVAILSARQRVSLEAVLILGWALLLALAGALSAAGHEPAPASPAELTDLSLEELASV